ncbi:MAG: nucleotide exchange factor GrpE [Acidimicrobiales bacterium]
MSSAGRGEEPAPGAIPAPVTEEADGDSPRAEELAWPTGAPSPETRRLPEEPPLPEEQPREEQAREDQADGAAQAVRERDEYLDALRRLQADFENYKKRMAKQQAAYTDRAAEALVLKLLPVLDTADLALAHAGGEEVKQLSEALCEALGKEGLERIDAQGAPFDPTLHDAVAHEPAEASGGEGDGDGDGAGQVVSEVLRAGYRWRGRVLRPAMVKVRG